MSNVTLFIPVKAVAWIAALSAVVAALDFGCESFTPVSNSVGTVSDLAELSEGTK